MAKRKSTHDKYVSKGERRSSVRTRSSDAAERLSNQQKAWHAGKNVMVTVKNPNPDETNKPFIRVPATKAWGRPKSERFIIR